MIIWYFVTFFCGILFGVLIMALMVGAKDHTVHVYKDPDGNVSVLTSQPEDIVEYHNVGGDFNERHRKTDE